MISLWLCQYHPPYLWHDNIHTKQNRKRHRIRKSSFFLSLLFRNLPAEKDAVHNRFVGSVSLTNRVTGYPLFNIVALFDTVPVAYDSPIFSVSSLRSASQGHMRFIKIGQQPLVVPSFMNRNPWQESCPYSLNWILQYTRLLFHSSWPLEADVLARQKARILNSSIKNGLKAKKW